MFDFDSQVIIRILMVVPALLIAATFHEFAHGWTADRLGDQTARLMGRLSLNPIRHIDPVGSIILPLIMAILPGGFMFGWAKPVPVNVYNLNQPKRDMGWVAAAGPISNFMLAVSASLFFHLISKVPATDATVYLVSPILIFLAFFIYINLILGVFNLLPVPPLDGGRIGVSVLGSPHSERLASLEPYGFMIVIMLAYVGIWGFILRPFISILLKFMSWLAGANLTWIVYTYY